MAVEVIVHVLKAKIEDTQKKFVLLGLANHSGPDGRNCYPSVRRLMAYTGLGESTVRRKLVELRDPDGDNLIRVVRESTRYRPTEYKINVDRLAAMEDPVFDELDGKTSGDLEEETPISGGPSDDAIRGPGTGGLDGQGSRNERSGVPERAIRGPALGPETYLNRSLTINGKRLILKFDQNPLIQALASIRSTTKLPDRNPFIAALSSAWFSIGESDGARTGILVFPSGAEDDRDYVADRAAVVSNEFRPLGLDDLVFMVESEWEGALE